MAAGSGILGLDQADPELSPDYLGALVPLAFKNQPALPVTGAAPPGGTAATSVAGTGVAPGGSVSVGGGGGSLTPSNPLLSSGVRLADLAQRLIPGGEGLPKGTGLPADQVSGGELALGSEVGNIGNLSEEFASQAGAGMSAAQGALVSGGAEAAAAAGTEAAAELALPTLGELGSAFTMAGPFISAVLGSTLFDAGDNVRGKVKETEAIRKAFGEAFPKLAEADATMGHLSKAFGLPADQQEAAFRRIIEEGANEQGSIDPVSQFTSTGGGRQHAKGGPIFGQNLDIPALDVSQIEAQTPRLYTEAALSQLAARDALAARGSAVDPLPWQPTRMLDLLMQGSGGNPQNISFREPTRPEEAGTTVALADETRGQPVNAYYLTPEESRAIREGPNSLDTALGILRRFAPEFESSMLGSAPGEIGSSGVPAATPTATSPVVGAGGPSPFASPSAMSPGGGGAELSEELLAV